MHNRRYFLSRCSARFSFTLFALSALLNVQSFVATSRTHAVVSSSGRHSSWSLGSKLLTQSSQHSNIVVRINPRIPPGGSGSATVLLMNANGQVLSAANASFGGLAKGVKGPPAVCRILTRLISVCCQQRVAFE